MSAGIEFVCYTSNALLLARALSSQSIRVPIITTLGFIMWRKKARLECTSRKLRSELFMRQSTFGCCALMPAAFFLVWMLPSLGRKIDAASGRAAFFVIQGEDVLML